VSCLSSSSCEAVGYRLISPAGTAAEGWDGSIWSSQSTPNPAGAFESVLSGLSCTSASACMAVGEYNQDFPLSERYS
jgi:hypothetical protein